MPLRYFRRRARIFQRRRRRWLMARRQQQLERAKCARCRRPDYLRHREARHGFGLMPPVWAIII